MFTVLQNMQFFFMDVLLLFVERYDLFIEDAKLKIVCITLKILRGFRTRKLFKSKIEAFYEL